MSTIEKAVAGRPRSDERARGPIRRRPAPLCLRSNRSIPPGCSAPHASRWREKREREPGHPTPLWADDIRSYVRVHLTGYKECRSSSTSRRRSLARTPANLQTQTRRRLLARGPAPNYALVAAPRRSGGSGQACSDDASALLRTHQGRAGSGLARRRGWPRRSRRVGRRVATIVADHPVSRSTA